MQSRVVSEEMSAIEAELGTMDNFLAKKRRIKIEGEKEKEKENEGRTPAAKKRRAREAFVTPEEASAPEPEEPEPGRRRSARWGRRVWRGVRACVLLLL